MSKGRINPNQLKAGPTCQSNHDAKRPNLWAKQPLGNCLHNWCLDLNPLRGSLQPSRAVLLVGAHADWATADMYAAQPRSPRLLLLVVQNPPRPNLSS